MTGKKRKRVVGKIQWGPKKGHLKENGVVSSGFSQPSVYHALIVIFLEFFAWGLLTSPMITVLNETFPNHTFLLNGLITGVKGLLSFLSAPLIGALSDVWGRKSFLLITVSFTCAPIPLMKISPMWYFAILSISGIFSVTFSVVFAYVADVTTEEDRGQAYGLVSATFAASLVTSPALGAYLGSVYSDNLVIWLATAVALFDVFFIMVAVPESLPEKLRPASWGSQISWEKADPFGALKAIGGDQLILLLCVTVFLSYLPEAGEYSCFFVYLRLIMGFSAEEVASYIALVGVLSVVAQTLILALLMKYVGHKGSILFGLVFEIIQLACYGFGSETWLMWTAGCMAAMSSVAQGIITGIRGLCNGLGPALFGFIFYLFHVDLDPLKATDKPVTLNHTEYHGLTLQNAIRQVVPGPPFAFGTILVIMALLVGVFIPENPHSSLGRSILRKPASFSPESFNLESGHRKHEKEPLMLLSESEPDI
ncbi:hypothetical protein KUTeg_016768 [Tegillarca granosa]|uniref:Major facilitator superfamily (MFS) profile domain-containing protein n=1 Tax=Tegillarca granosa TaxID=220873 RepID=A0ABQ9ESI1_TEGGR|nr:hypothetical protein KUTeg_016768 [Tegillarca granosa]